MIDLQKLFEEDRKKRDKVIYYNNRKSYMSRLLDLRELAEEKRFKTGKIKYYEACEELDDILNEVEDGLDNETMKRCIDCFTRLK